MPFKKITRGRNEGKYRSPTGRVLTREQVKAYYAKKRAKRAKRAKS